MSKRSKALSFRLVVGIAVGIDIAVDITAHQEPDLAHLISSNTSISFR